MQEIWKVYREKSRYKCKIEVSNFGRVKLRGKIKELKLSIGQLYYIVCGIYVHRMVAEMFIPNPENKPEIDHIDTNKLNNNVNNLRWVTRKENLNNPTTLQNYSIANKLPSKHRLDSRYKLSKTITEKWKDPEYRNKVLKNRPHTYNVNRNKEE